MRNNQMQLLRKIIILGIFLMCGLLFTGCRFLGTTPFYERNVGVDGIKMSYRTDDDKRLPIIRTFHKEDYTQENQREAEEFIAGEMEGDLPALHLKNGKSPVTFNFSQSGKPVTLSAMPTIHLTATDSNYEQEKVIDDKLIELGKGRYQYTFTKLFPPDQAAHSSVGEYRFEIHFTIDNQDYIALSLLPVFAEEN